NVRQVSEAPIKALQKIAGYDAPEAAESLKSRAAAVVEKAGDALAGPIAPATEDGKGSFTAAPMKDAKALAEERLREMMRQASGGAEAPDSGGTKSES